MGDVTIPFLIDLLITALRDRRRRTEAIDTFQRAIREGEHPDAWEWDMFVELAHDLDLYEPNGLSRLEDDKLYGEEKLEQEIREALRRLRAHGHSMPPGLSLGD